MTALSLIHIQPPIEGTSLIARRHISEALAWVPQNTGRKWIVQGPYTHGKYPCSDSGNTRKNDLLAPDNLHFVKGIRRKFPLPRLRGLKTGLGTVSRLNSSQNQIYENVFGGVKNLSFCFYFSWNSGERQLYSSYSFKETHMLLFLHVLDSFHPFEQIYFGD